MSQSATDSVASPRLPRRRWAKGPERPEYLRPGDLDRLMMMLVSLMSEVSALRDRLDTHEALAGRADHAAVEAYVATPERAAAREAERHAMLKRVLRPIAEDREAALLDPKAAGHGDQPD